MVENFSPEMLRYIDSECLAADKSFQNQHRVFATKRGWFLRPTVKLDPVAEFFLYDLVYENRALFKTRSRPTRTVLGYRIEGGARISGRASYREYKEAVKNHKAQFKYHAYLDVSSYFTHIYHHDLVTWWQEANGSPEDAKKLSKFLRAMSARSIDCLPQGIYPSKMIGSAFLNFLENASRIRSAQSVRLMDDFWIFDNDPAVLIADFMLAQSLLSAVGLTINEQKSQMPHGLSGAEQQELPLDDLDQMKIHLLRRRSEELIKTMGDMTIQIRKLKKNSNSTQPSTNT